jgi:hypothetical protein
MRVASSLPVLGALLLLAATLPAVAAGIEGAAGGPYEPAGSLYDNGQAADTFPYPSQESTGASLGRAADDFTIPIGACASGIFEVTQVRIQMVQSDVAGQPFAVDFYRDDGTGTAPTAGISPFVTLEQKSSVNLGLFTIGRLLWEASLVPESPLRLNGGIKYWISGFGATAAANPGNQQNNFFAGSDGAADTPKNGVLIAPNGRHPSWTPVEQANPGNPAAFSFAIDGACVPFGSESAFDVAVPDLSTAGIAVLAALMAAAAMALLRRSF